MKRKKLKRLLIIERNKFASSKTFEEVSEMEFPVVYQVGNIKDKDFYQVEIDILDKTEKYILIDIFIDDGTWWKSFCPIGTSFIVYKDGKIAKYNKKNSFRHLAIKKTKWS